MVFSRIGKIMSALLVLAASPVLLALEFNLSCPDQEYVLAGNESDYYFINGMAKISWKDHIKKIDVQGRFLDAGLPSSLKLTTLSIEAELYSDRRGISFYCNLSNAAGVRVAFVRTSFLLKDVGIKGVVAGCTAQGAITHCRTMDV